MHLQKIQRVKFLQKAKKKFVFNKILSKIVYDIHILESNFLLSTKTKIKTDSL